MKIEKLVSWLTTNKDKLRFVETAAVGNNALMLTMVSSDWAHVSKYVDVAPAVEVLVEREKYVAALLKPKPKRRKRVPIPEGGERNGE